MVTSSTPNAPHFSPHQTLQTALCLDMGAACSIQMKTVYVLGIEIAQWLTTMVTRDNTKEVPNKAIITPTFQKSGFRSL